MIAAEHLNHLDKHQRESNSKQLEQLVVSVHS